MNPAATTEAKQAFTLIELLVVVVIVVVLLITAMPTHKGAKVSKANAVQCMSNLRQIGLGLIMYAQDHKDLFPWQVSTNQGGTEELISNGVAADHFAKLAPYLLATRVLVCPTDKERQVGATNYFGFSNSNLSYFTSLDVKLAPAATNIFALILSGDRHLARNNQPLNSGLFSATNSAALSWTKELHWAKNQAETLGVMAFADGHCEAVKSTKLPATFQRQNLATRLVIP
jgi:prepilin-type N-terminal cleavage/methylation domain-containing protein